MVTMFVQNEMKKTRTQNAVKAEISMKTKSFHDSAKRLALSSANSQITSNTFLVHRSWRLGRTIMIMCCPPSFRPSLTFLIFNFFSETTEQNSTKLDRKQDLYFLYQVCVFRADRKNKMAALASDWLRHFQLLLWNHWTEFNETWQEARSQRPHKVCVFWADLKNKMAALASDWLRHFRLLLWNRWSKFHETWQEARFQRPLPSLYFLGRSVNKDGCPGRFLKKVAHCTQVHNMWPFGPLVMTS